jgi:DNA invertase Pin-like site-specific DNA recombinase
MSSKKARCDNALRAAYRLIVAGRKMLVAGIASMLGDGMSWSAVQAATGCSRATVTKVAQRAKPVAGPNR